MPPAFAIGAFVVGVTAAVASVAASVVVAIAAVVGPVLAAVGSTIGGIVSAIGAVVGPILSTVGEIVGGIVTTIGSVLGPVIKAVGGVLETISAGIQAGLDVVKAKIAWIDQVLITPIKGFIGDVMKAMYAPVKPILEPIRDSLVAIRDFVVDTRTWIVTELKPVADLVEFIQDISAIVIIKDLLTGTSTIGDIIGRAGETADAATLEAITVLYRDIVQTTTGTLEIVRNHYTRLSDTINDTDERLRKDMDLAIAYTKETIQGEIDKVRDALSDRILPIEHRIAAIERRAMDLPFFQEMLIRALD